LIRPPAILYPDDTNMNALLSPSGRHAWRLLLICAWFAVLMVGCGRPQVAPQNLRLTASLRTALSAKNNEWLEQNVTAIEERRTAGQMSDDEYAAFQAIIAQAKAGEWEAAEQEAVKLQKAQRPTQGQVEALVQPVED
jgi:hypothetical protein